MLCLLPEPWQMVPPKPDSRAPPRPTESELGRRDRDIHLWLSMAWILMGDQEEGASVWPLAPLEPPPSQRPTGFLFWVAHNPLSLGCIILPSGNCKEGIIWHANLSKPRDQDHRSLGFERNSCYHGNCSPHLISRTTGHNGEPGRESRVWVGGAWLRFISEMGRDEERMKNAAFGEQPLPSRELRAPQSHLLLGVECLYNWPLNNMGLNYMGPRIREF